MNSTKANTHIIKNAVKMVIVPFFFNGMLKVF